MRIGILGTGLIGTSAALGWSRLGFDVVGWDPDSDVLQRASAVGALRPVERSEATAADLDVVVLAAPPSSVVDIVAGTEIDAQQLVIDVSGIKAPVIAAAGGRRFVGTHPMAGREVSGPDAASPDLFRGAAWVVTTDGADPTDLAFVEDLVGRLGARPVRMTAADHDVAVAVISHLPQLLASTLVNEAAARTDALDLVAGSFRDLTRVAASEPDLWVDLMDANRGPLLDVLDDFVDRLRQVADGIAARSHDDVHRNLASAQHHRRSLAAPVAGVRIAIADRPGELVRVGRAFEATGVDVRDLQLRHAPHGGGGVLTVSVHIDDEPAMRAALEAAGLLLVD